MKKTVTLREYPASNRHGRRIMASQSKRTSGAIPCPECGVIGKLKTIDSRMNTTTMGWRVRRRRSCGACNLRFTTVEVVMGDVRYVDPLHTIPERSYVPGADNAKACPNCTTRALYAVDSRWYGNPWRVRRRYQCRRCGIRFTTYETIAEGSVFVDEGAGI